MKKFIFSVYGEDIADLLDSYNPEDDDINMEDENIQNIIEYYLEILENEILIDTYGLLENVLEELKHSGFMEKYIKERHDIE